MGGPVMFTGSTNAPELVLRYSSTVTAVSWSYHNPDGSIITAGGLTNASITTTPEPATTVLVASGLRLCLFRLRTK